MKHTTTPTRCPRCSLNWSECPLPARGLQLELPEPWPGVVDLTARHCPSCATGHGFVRMANNTWHSWAADAEAFDLVGAAYQDLFAAAAGTDASRVQSIWYWHPLRGEAGLAFDRRAIELLAELPKPAGWRRRLYTTGRFGSLASVQRAMQLDGFVTTRHDTVMPPPMPALDLELSLEHHLHVLGPGLVDSTWTVWPSVRFSPHRLACPYDAETLRTVFDEARAAQVKQAVRPGPGPSVSFSVTRN